MIEMMFIVGLVFSVFIAYISHKKKWKIADFF